MSTLESQCKHNLVVETFPCAVSIANILGKYSFDFKLLDGLKACDLLLYQQFKDITISVSDRLITSL